MVNVSTPAALRLKVPPINAARVFGNVLAFSALSVEVDPASLLMMVLAVPATVPEAAPSKVCPL